MGAVKRRETLEKLTAITTKIFINDEKRLPKFIDKDYMCRDPSPLSLGQPPSAGVGAQSLSDQRIKDLTTQEILYTGKIGMLHLQKFSFNE